MEGWQLQQRLSLPYEAKKEHAFKVAMEFHDYFDGMTYCSVGGIDSRTLLAFLRKNIDKNIPAVSVLSIECKSNQRLISDIENLIPVIPIKSQVEVIREYGFPVGSKDIALAVSRLRHPTVKNAGTRNAYLTGIKSDGTFSKYMKLSKFALKLVDAPFETSPMCCYYMKEEPLNRYSKESGRRPFMGILADESFRRRGSYIRTGCNSFKKRGARSWPFAIFTKSDVLRMALELGVEPGEEYGSIIQNSDGTYTTTRAKRSGCPICGFGLHLEERPHRFDRINEEDPRKYDFLINTLGWGKVMDYIGVEY